MADTSLNTERMRIDKWLWAARFYKTRALAVDEIHKGRVRVNDQDCKPARDIKVGDQISVRQGYSTRTVIVQGLSPRRGPAPVAQQLYEETPDSIALRATLAEQRHYAAEPAHAIQHGRPTKRDRRQLQQARENPDAASGWGKRWSASLDG
ncbi:RNA-binding S4 domain-containing protein [Brachymonas sp. G13]|uniref:RNA-binding S4 domain-containing protein n=1 Tax=Brachymonas wangyanguii TaxID=3130163 RepID=UPI0016BA1F96|nr:RNA-binding S4 domain-containing protein [Ramlibacter sp.]